MRAPLAENEPERLKALREFEILDTLPEPAFDDLTALAAHICEAPIAVISLVDEHRQWFKSKVGLDATQTPRDVAFCAHAILQPDLFVVQDALTDKRFADNPLVTSDPHIRFYAGSPLVTDEGHALGTLCVIDRVPRTLKPDQEQALRVLTRHVTLQLELRRKSQALAKVTAERNQALKDLEKTLAGLEDQVRERTEELGKSNAILREQAMLLDLAPVLVRDLQGGIILWNTGAEKLYGWAKTQALGKIAQELLQTQFPKPLKEIEAQVLSAGSWEGELVHTKRDGDRVVVASLWILHRDHEGNPASILEVNNDISELKKAEHALEEKLVLQEFSKEVSVALARTADLRVLLQECAEAAVRCLGAAFARIWVLNDETNVLDLQASAGTYTHLDGPHGHVPVGQFKIGLIAKERKPHLTNSVVGDPHVNDQEWAKREGMIAFAGYPLEIEDRLSGVMAMFSRQPLSQAVLDAFASVAGEIAQCIERKQAEDEVQRQAEDLRQKYAELERANKIKDEFLNVVSHELKTPLNILLGYSRMIGEGMMGEVTSQQGDALKKVLLRGQELLDLITRILLATQIMSRSLVIERQRVRLSDLMEDLKNTTDVPVDKDLVLKWDYAPDLPAVVTEEAKMKGILQALIDNAIKFTGAGSVSVSVRALPQRNLVTFEVADTGPGIPSEFIPAIFEKFRQMDSSDTRPYEGLGLGLFIAKNLTELLGGRLEVDSEVGNGSTFSVTIPQEQ